MYFWKRRAWTLSRELVDEACNKSSQLRLDGGGPSQNPWSARWGPITPRRCAFDRKPEPFFPGQKKDHFYPHPTKALEEMLIQWQKLENSRLIHEFEDPRAYSQEEIRAGKWKPSAWGKPTGKSFYKTGKLKMMSSSL